MAKTYIWLLMLIPSPALASGPEVAIVPPASEGLTPDTLEILDSTIRDKVSDLGYTPVSSPSVFAAKSMGVAKTITTQIVRTGEEVTITLTVHSATTTAKSSVTTSTSGVLAQTVKLLKKALPPPEPVTPKPAPVVQKPAPKVTKPAPRITKPAPPKENLDIVYSVWEDYNRNATAMIAAGTITTLVGAAFTVTAAVLWKRFDDWQKWAKRTNCLECISQGDDKIRLNAAITGLAVAHILPGVMVLILGISKRVKALRLKNEMTMLIPDLNLALSPDLRQGDLTLTWNF